MLSPLVRYWPVFYAGTGVILISLIGASNIINYYPEIPSSLYSDFLPKGIKIRQHRLFVHPDQNKNWWNHRFRYLKRRNLLMDPQITTGFGLVANSLSSKCKEFYSTQEILSLNEKIWRFCSIGGTEIKTIEKNNNNTYDDIDEYAKSQKDFIPSFTDRRTKWFWIMQDKLFFGFNGLGKDATDDDWKNLYLSKRNYGDTKVRDKCMELIKKISSYKKYCYLTEHTDEPKQQPKK